MSSFRRCIFIKRAKSDRDYYETIESPLWSKTLRSISLSFFPKHNTLIYIYMCVCVCRENTLLLTGNPGYCNLPRLDSTCLSAVWYRVGHCCNWSRNAIALLIIEIINGPRYRVGSYSKYLDKSRYGVKEDVSRCSLSKIYIYMYARVPSWLWKEVVYIELIFTFISFSAKREEENKVRVFFFSSLKSSGCWNSTF